jgi:acyl-CoA reductase-like NAD-dependent aldehyde dehydrogenase
VHESVYDEMCDELAELANAAIVDDGLKQGAKLGPMQNKMQYEKVKGYLEDAPSKRQNRSRRRGARPSWLLHSADHRARYRRRNEARG